MTLAFFPEIYPDELIYSAVARYSDYMGLSGSGTHKVLLGRAERRLSYDIPNTIKRLVDRVGTWDLNNVVRDHTLLPFYTALSEEGKYHEARSRMVAGERIGFLVKPARVAAPWPNRLRYCPQCEEDCRRLYGAPIWLRRHQLVTSIICPEHGDILRESQVDVSAQRARHYEPASKPKINSEAVACAWSSQVMTQYHDLTVLGHAMLRSQEEPGKWSPQIDFVDLAQRNGFGAKHPGWIDMAGLISEFNRRYAKVLEIWPQLDNWEGRVGQHWLHLVIRETRKMSPVNYALARLFLEGHPDGAGVTRKRPSDGGSTTPKLKPDFDRTRTTAGRDGEIADEVRRAAAFIRERTPPERVDRTSIVRSLDGIHAAMKHHHMPLTQKALEEEHEDRKRFLRRRLRWVFDEAAERGEVVTVKQLTGTYSFRDLPIVEDERENYYRETD